MASTVFRELNHPVYLEPTIGGPQGNSLRIDFLGLESNNDRTHLVTITCHSSGVDIIKPIDSSQFTELVRRGGGLKRK